MQLWSAGLVLELTVDWNTVLYYIVYDTTLLNFSKTTAYKASYHPIVTGNSDSDSDSDNDNDNSSDAIILPVL